MQSILYKGVIWTHNTSETEGISSAYMESEVYSDRDKNILYHPATSCHYVIYGAASVYVDEYTRLFVLEGKQKYVYYRKYSRLFNSNLLMRKYR